MYFGHFFFKTGLRSAVSVKRSRRELSIDVAEHKSVSKNGQNKYYPRFSFMPKTGIAFRKMGVLFLLCCCRINIDLLFTVKYERIFAGIPRTFF